ncbi:recombinase family protein [Rhodoblastus sp. 17X3]|uniref:recombinase family protein n=1 Tax=Rhodoblastus sp. 17X3 TaxID=3047026 RepID=UPI0024B654C0|nr:recombinase family protein [Rhodoblastus sp. 17X3]MDI9849674.1 recombinase family protein [Rhodoblastus sp. 17X3]
MRNDAKPAKALRCAIYTRVSTDSGLEQDFNSLDNQREASEAYIKSQAHEGWKLLREHYDDGGYSGGTMDRPALQRLLNDVRARRFDVIVVYKVDRLTRSLADFAKLVELFDAHCVSFISVTQSFNTTTSMGRLTLNMLLSFAQFEREITGERIRDKVEASKKKGIWMGGALPVGYRVVNRALQVVEADADFVRMLFRRYLELGSVVRLKAALDAEGATSPIRVTGTGRATGGKRLSRGHLYSILSNPIYIGKLRHKDQLHNGLHSAIVDREVWDRAQTRLAFQTQLRREAAKDELSFLAGKLFDDRGNRMGASFAAKGSRRWRYYVSRAALTGRTQDAGSIVRVSAPQIEAFVTGAVKKHMSGQPSQQAFDRGCAGADLTSATARSATVPDVRPLSDAEIAGLIESVTLGAGTVEIVLADVDALEDQGRKIVLAWTPGSTRRKREIVQSSDPSEPRPNRAMRTRAREVFVNAFSEAHRWLDELVTDPTITIASLAAREHKSERSIRMILSLAFLSPDLAKSAIGGCLPRGFNRSRLVDLPMLWSEQWRVLGLQQPAADWLGGR